MGAVDTPKIYNVETGERMIINMEMQAGDDIDINTIQGEKSIKFTREGVTTNIIGRLDHSSSWLQMFPGDNVMTVDAESGLEYVLVTFTMTDQYEGV